MMLSHPVLLGILWSLLLHTSTGQSEENNKVYAYSYHFQHNGTTDSKEILRRVLGTDPDIGLDPTDGKSIVKTFYTPSIRGFFTKGVLPAGPLTSGYNSGFGFRSNFNAESPVDGIRKIVESNLQPPNRNILPPVSPDIKKEFPNDFNDVNHLGNPFRNQDDFPKIPPIPPPPVLGNNNNGVSRVQTFSRDTPDGGKIVGRVETFSYNSPPSNNALQNIQGNSQGYRRNENFVNNRQEVSGYRTQSYFRQQFRTVTPNLDTNINLNPNRVDSRANTRPNNNNNNQWWNAFRVLGGNNKNLDKPPQLTEQIRHNVNQIQNNLNSNRAFGARLSNLNRQNQQEHNAHRDFRNDVNAIPMPPYQNYQNNLANNVPESPRVFNRPNVPMNPPVNNNYLNRNQFRNNAHVNNYNNHFNDDTEKKVMNLIQDVNSRLNNLNNNVGGQRINNIGLTWDDDVNPYNINNDWSRRMNGRPFSNAHSGAMNNPLPKPVEPVELLKTTLEALVGGRDFQIPSITGNGGGNYRNSGGGGMENYFGSDRVVEGPNSFSRNQQRGYERNFHVNSDRGYQRSNQWSTNNVRRLDAQSSKNDFSKDFIDVFREDY